MTQMDKQKVRKSGKADGLRERYSEKNTSLEKFQHFLQLILLAQLLLKQVSTLTQLQGICSSSFYLQSTPVLE